MYDKVIMNVLCDDHDSTIRRKLQERFWLKTHPREYFPTVYYNEDYYGNYSFHIEFSASKILYGTNLLETTGRELELMCQHLEKKLAMMGLYIPFDDLWFSSSLGGLEICKNVWLNELPTAIVINYLRKFSPPRSRMVLEEDTYTKGQYRIDQCRFVGKTQEATFYNKTQELQKEVKLECKQLSDQPNILRFESRINKSVLQVLTGRKKLSLADLAALGDTLYIKVLKRYWDPFVEFGKYMPVYVSAEDQLARIKHELTSQQHIRLLAFKSMVAREGVCCAKEYFKRNFGESLAISVWTCFKKYPILNIVQPRYSILDKLDKALYHPHWWLKKEDIFYPNPEPFSFDNYMVEDFWTTKDSAKYLGIGERAVQNKCRDGEIPCCLIGGKYRLKKGDVMDYAYSQKVGAKESKSL